MKPLGLHVFSSVKGGVGKSTLAVTTAKLLARRGHVPVVVEADMLAASLADNLRLCAPVVEVTAEGLLDLEAPATNRWYTPDETWSLREKRRSWLEGPNNGIGELSCPPPAYLNDALHYPLPDPQRECSVGGLLWKHAHDDGVWYLPSSPLLVDAYAAAPYALGAPHGFHWVRRLSWVFEALLEQQPSITDFVIDLPPGPLGTSHEMMVWLRALTKRWTPSGYPKLHEKRLLRLNPFVVMSQDQRMSLEYFLYVRPHVENLALLCNKLHGSRTTVRKQVEQSLPWALQGLGFAETIRFIPILSKLLDRFVRGPLKSEEIEEIEKAGLFIDLRLGP